MMRILVLTGSVYLVLTGLRLFAAVILEAVHGGCTGCPCKGPCRNFGEEGKNQKAG